MSPYNFSAMYERALARYCAPTGDRRGVAVRDVCYMSRVWELRIVTLGFGKETVDEVCVHQGTYWPYRREINIGRPPEEWQTELEYVTLMHEIGHSRQPFEMHQAHSAGDTLPAECDAWEWAIAHSEVWNTFTQAFMGFCLLNYVNNHPAVSVKDLALVNHAMRVSRERLRTGGTDGE